MCIHHAAKPESALMAAAQSDSSMMKSNIENVLKCEFARDEARVILGIDGGLDERSFGDRIRERFVSRGRVVTEGELAGVVVRETHSPLISVADGGEADVHDAPRTRNTPIRR